MKSKLFYFLFGIILTNVSFANTQNKGIRMTSFQSDLSQYNSRSFENNVIKILTSLDFEVKIDSNLFEKSDYSLEGKVILRSENPHSYIIKFTLSSVRTGRIVDIGEKVFFDKEHRAYYASTQSALSKILFFSSDKINETYFMPGAAWDIYQPRSADISPYSGPSVEYVFYARSKFGYTSGRGPSRIKTYGKIGILTADAESPDVLLLNSGINLSFESKTYRKIFIPYFGVDLGGLFNKDFSTFHFTPLVGIQLYSSDKINACIQSGYLYSLQKFETYSGYNLKASVNLLLW